MDDERLKNPAVGDNEAPDYFDELLERIRDIRASERRMYLRVREIFSMAADYRIGFKETTQFFTFIQDKLHVAATGRTSAELIMERANHLLPHMGLTNHPRPDVRKCDTIVGKNYLNETEIKTLNRIVTMWLDFAEDQATRRKQIFLKDWVEKLDAFLRFNDRPVLQTHGKISRTAANEHAYQEYEQFSADQRMLKEAEGRATVGTRLGRYCQKAASKQRKEIMDWSQFLAMLGVTILGSGGISGLIVYLWRKQIDQKYEHELEGYKAGYQRFLQENDIRFSRWHNDQAQAITELYSDLSLLHLSLQILTQPMHRHPADEEGERSYFNGLLRDVWINYEKAQLCWYKNKIFMSEQSKKVDELLWQCRAATVHYEGALEKWNMKDYQEAESACEKFGDILEILRKELFDILHGK